MGGDSSKPTGKLHKLGRISGGIDHHSMGWQISVIRAPDGPCSKISQIGRRNRCVMTVGPVPARILPLFERRTYLLVKEEPAAFVIKYPRVFFRIEITAFPALVGPATGYSVYNLAKAGFSATVIGGFIGGFAGFMAPQPSRHIIFGNRNEIARDAVMNKTLFQANVPRAGRPMCRKLDYFGVGLVWRKSSEIWGKTDRKAVVLKRRSSRTCMSSGKFHQHPPTISNLLAAPPGYLPLQRRKHFAAVGPPRWCSLPVYSTLLY